MRYQDVVARDRPVGYWPLNELSGTSAANRGSAGAAGTYTGSPALAAVPFPSGGRAPWFSATTQYVTIADNAAWSVVTTGALTVEAWYYTNATVASGSRRCIFSKANIAGNNEWFLYHESDAFYGLNTWNWDVLTLAGGDHLTCLGGNGSANQIRWFHLVGTVTSGSRADLYVNGRLVATDSTSSGSLGDGTSDLRIGDDRITGATAFSVAHAAVYNYILPQNRILAHYRAGIARPRRLPLRTVAR